MAEVQKEQKATVAERQLPVATRETTLHAPIAVISTAAQNLRVPAEGTYPTTAQADFASRVRGNVDRLRLEGSTPMAERFLELLQAIRG